MELAEALQRETGKTLEEIQELGKNNLFFFAHGICGFTKMSAPGHTRLCSFIEDESVTRKGWLMPRGSGKTTTTKSRLLQWIVRKPDVRILYMCKTAGAASGAITDMENRILGKGAPLLPILYPHIVPPRLRDTTWSTTQFTVPRKGSWDEHTVEAAGIGTNKTRFHYDIIVLDDPLSPSKEDFTAEDVRIDPEVMEQLIGFMELQVDGLFDPNGLRILYYAGVRWGPNDAIGWLKKNRPEIKWCEVPLVDENWNPNFPLSYPLEACKELERNKGSFFFQTQYMNIPVAIDNKAFQRRDMQFYHKAPAMKDMFITITCDPATGKHSALCDTAILAAGTKKDGGTYVLDYTSAKLTARETITEVMRFCKKYNPDILSFESVAYQAVLEEFLREAQRAESTRWRIVPLTRNKSSKDSRIMKIQPFIENHDVFFRDAGMDKIIQDLVNFPHGDKDLLDTLADHIELVGKYFSRDTVLRPREEDIQRFEAESADSTDVELSRVVFTERNEDTGALCGYVLLVGVNHKTQTLYIIDAVGLGGDVADPYAAAKSLGEKAGKTLPCVAEKETKRLFFSGTDIPVRGVNLGKNLPTGEVASAKITRGNIILNDTAGVDALVKYDALGFKAIEFAEHALMRKRGNLTCDVAGAVAPKHEVLSHTSFLSRMFPR